MTEVGEGGVVAETPRLVIRPWRAEEADRLFDVLRRTEVVRWLGPGSVMTHSGEASERIARWAVELAADPRFGRWAAVERSSGIPAGTVLLKPLPDGEGEVEIGWHFHPDSWGKGLARLPGVTHRWYHEPSLMFWAAGRLDQPSLAPDEPLRLP